MTPEQVELLGLSSNQTTWLEPNTDIFKLQPGLYAGIKLINSSLGKDRDELLIISIKQYDTDHKIIAEFISVTGELLVKNIHVNQDGENAGSPSGWTKIYRYTKLWSGYTGEIGTKLTLTEDVSKFADIRVLIDNGNGQQEFKTLRIGGNPADLTLESTHTWSTGYNHFALGINVDKKSITITSNININTNLKGEGTSMESAVKIKQIEGVC